LAFLKTSFNDEEGFAIWLCDAPCLVPRHDRDHERRNQGHREISEGSMMTFGDGSPQAATAELARMVEAQRGPAPVAVPQTSAEAKARLDSLSTNAELAQRLLSGNAEAVQEFNRMNHGGRRDAPMVTWLAPLSCPDRIGEG
jgi:hypothetical protein